MMKSQHTNVVERVRLLFLVWNILIKFRC